MQSQKQFLSIDLKQLLVNLGTQITSDKINNSIAFLNEYKYYITDILGAGAFGLVLKSINSESNKIVAIKLMIAQNADQRKLCIEEAMKIKLVKSDYVIQVYEWYEDDKNECIYIVTECCEMGDLCKYVKKNNFNLDIKVISSIVQKILLGVEDIHKSNIIHSDLKPSNILLTKDLGIKICDLGLSKKLSLSKSHVSTNAGTFCYQALEQIQNKLVKESDYYAVGSILCYICKVPIESDFTLSYKMKFGEFPLIKEEQYKGFILLAYQMMNTNPLFRIKPQESIKRLKEIEDNKFEFIQWQNVQQNIQDIKYIGKYIDGKKSGKGYEYFQNGKISFEGTWKNDKKEGSGIFYDKEGNKSEAKFINGLIEGQVIEYYPNNQKKSCCNYANGQKDGDYEEYYENGILKSSGKYSKNQKTDRWREYYSNKEIKYSGNYQNDQKHGIGEFYSEIADESYEGQWEEGLYHGKGIYSKIESNSNQSIYYGSFQFGLKHGKGVEKFFIKNSNNQIKCSENQKNNQKHENFIKHSNYEIKCLGNQKYDQKHGEKKFNSQLVNEQVVNQNQIIYYESFQFGQKYESEDNQCIKSEKDINQQNLNNMKKYYKDRILKKNQQKIERENLKKINKNYKNYQFSQNFLIDQDYEEYLDYEEYQDYENYQNYQNQQNKQNQQNYQNQQNENDHDTQINSDNFKEIEIKIQNIDSDESESYNQDQILEEQKKNQYEIQLENFIEGKVQLQKGCYQNKFRIKFKGEYFYGKKIKGKLKFQEYEYIGEIDDDQINGIGIIRSRKNKNKIYEGEFFYGMFNGKGILYNSDGSYYKGVFMMNTLVSGVKYNSDGNILEKIKCQDKQKVEQENTFYYGSLNEDKQFEGYGILVSKKQYEIIYAGEFKSNLRCGYGIQYLEDETKIIGMFKNNVCIQGLVYKNYIFQGVMQEGILFTNIQGQNQLQEFQKKENSVKLILNKNIQDSIKITNQNISNEMSDDSQISKKILTNQDNSAKPTFDLQTYQIIFIQDSSKNGKFYLFDKSFIIGDINISQGSEQKIAEFKNVKYYLDENNIKNQSISGQIYNYQSRQFLYYKINDDQKYQDVIIFEKHTSKVYLEIKQQEKKFLTVDSKGNFQISYNTDYDINSRQYLKIPFAYQNNEQSHIYQAQSYYSIDNKITHYFGDQVAEMLDVKHDKIYFGTVLDNQMNYGGLFDKMTGLILNKGQFKNGRLQKGIIFRDGKRLKESCVCQIW